MTKSETLKNFNKEVRELFEDSFGHTIDKIMERLGFDCEDMRNFIGKDIVGTSPTHALNAMSSFELLKFMTLISAKTSYGETKNETECKIDDLIDEYNKTKSQDKKRTSEKVDMLLKLFGVSDENDLDNLLTAVTDVKEAIQQAARDIDNSDCDTECKPDTECDGQPNECGREVVSETDNGGCEQTYKHCRHGKSPYSRCRDTRCNSHHAKKEHREECGDKKCGEAEYYMYHYDSDTMDKPTVKVERLKFDPKTQTIDDILKEMRERFSVSDSDN